MDTRAANRIVTQLLAGQTITDIAAGHGLSESSVRTICERLCEVGLLQAEETGYTLAVAPLAGATLGPYRLRHRYVVDSTNRWAKTQDDAAEPTVYAAEVQTAGRGRHDRQWASPAGGLWCTLTLRPRTVPRKRALHTLAMAVAIVNALTVADVAATIKWPNDVLLAGEKLAGILTEYTEPWLRVGVGLNAAVPVEHLPTGATSLQAHDSTVARGRLAAGVLEQFARLMTQPDRILPQWRTHAATLDEQVRIETSTEVITGRAVDVTETGALQIATEAGQRTVTAGDCTHLRRS